MEKIGLVQVASCGDMAVNLKTLHRFAEEACLQGCEALCFPECFLTGYFPERAAELAIPRAHPALDAVSGAAKTWAVDILVGFMEREEDRCFITHGLFRRDGGRCFYRKTHLGQKEQRFFTPGDALEVFSLTCGLRVGLQLCVETHYPEITQTLALKGAEVVFAPHAVPRAAGDRQRIWSKYIPARSYDNRVYMACCNLWDEGRFGGGCLVSDPQGEIAACAFGPGEALLSCEVHREAVAPYREAAGKYAARFYPAKRRPELYRHP